MKEETPSAVCSNGSVQVQGREGGKAHECTCEQESTRLVPCETLPEEVPACGLQRQLQDCKTESKAVGGDTDEGESDEEGDGDVGEGGRGGESRWSGDIGGEEGRDKDEERDHKDLRAGSAPPPFLRC